MKENNDFEWAEAGQRDELGWVLDVHPPPPDVSFPSKVAPPPASATSSGKIPNFSSRVKSLPV